MASTSRRRGWRRYRGGSLLFRLADDVDELDAVGDADALEHLAEVACGGCVDERRVPFQPHRFDHAEDRERVDEAGGGLRRRDAVMHRQYLAGAGKPVLRIHSAATEGNRLAHQGLSFGRGTGSDDDASPLVAGGHRLADPAGHRGHDCGGELRGHDGVVAAA